jgi:CBS domain-containing protein
MKISQAMSTAFTLISPDTPIRKAAQLMRDGDFGYLPIGENDHLTGAVTDRDIVVRGIAEGCDLDDPVRQVMSTKVIYCFDDDEIDDAADVMEANQIRRLVILNRSKRMVGVLSLGDIARECRDHGLTGEIETKVAQPAL